MGNHVAIITTTYNSQSHIGELIYSLGVQTYKNFKLYIADDGSTDLTNEVIERMKEDHLWIEHLKLPHGERGIARVKAIEAAEEGGYDFLLIIDSDMVLESNLLETAIDTFSNNTETGALVIREKPVSNFKNPMTKIKVFERTVINNATEVGGHSVEAARFWRASAYKASGGIHPDQISFEEIQPTIRYMEDGGTVEKIMTPCIIHDEKEVTVKNLFGKKLYHFEKMPNTLTVEKSGFLKAIKRWYFFRPVLYQNNNLKLYLKHPLLTLGMLSMYMVLTGAAVVQIGRHFLRRFKHVSA